jgi:hypothetical protein
MRFLYNILHSTVVGSQRNAHAVPRFSLALSQHFHVRMRGRPDMPFLSKASTRTTVPDLGE